ncbi:hypothetical protein HY798_03350, partial [Candidatus Falkowbacteria bacterium]|nr:hypothetical protein [Candidatus Falkowbacteria bacterium]
MRNDNVKLKNKKIFIFLFIAVAFVIFYFPIFNFSFLASPALGPVLSVVEGASPAAASSGQADAIAIRVIPNYSHYSPSRWYSQQGFTGSPQSLTVDGYEAVRDGRTVYV